MALSTQTIKVVYSGNGSTTAFAVPFVFWANADVKAVKITAAGVETALSVATHYTLSGGNGATGTLTMLTAPIAGDKLAVYFDRAAAQDETFAPAGAYRAQAHERTADKAQGVLQKLESAYLRTLRVPIEEEGFVLPRAQQRASNLLSFGPDGITPTMIPEGDLAAAVEAAEEALDSQTAAAASATAALASQTAAAASATAAGNSQTAAAASATAALASQTAAAASATAAENSQTAAAGSATAAATAQANATTQVALATTQAGIANTQAGIATTQATTATAQAVIATAKAAEASGYVSVVNGVLSVATTAALSSYNVAAQPDGLRAQLILDGREDQINYRLDKSGALGANAQNAVSRFVATGGTNWYWVRSFNAIIPFEQAGGGVGKTGAENSAALQAILAAIGPHGRATILFGHDPTTTNGNILTSTWAYDFATTVTQSVTQHVTYTSVNRALIDFNPSSAGSQLIALSGSTGDNGGWVWNVDGYFRNDSKLQASTFGRIRTWALKDCKLIGTNYLIDNRTDYTYNPSVDNVLIQGSKSGFRWRGNGVDHVTSKATINRLHIQNGTGEKLRGPKIWLQGWQGLTGEGNILEGVATRSTDGDYELCNGQGVFNIFLHNCTGIRGGYLDGWQEYSSGTEPAGDLAVYVLHTQGGHLDTVNFTLKGGLGTLSAVRVENTNPALIRRVELILEDGYLLTAEAYQTINSIITVKNALLSTNQPLFNDPNVYFDNCKYTAYNLRPFVVEPPYIEVINYKGGYLTSGGYGFAVDTVDRFVQNDPVMGSTFMFLYGNSPYVGFPVELVHPLNLVFGVLFRSFRGSSNGTNLANVTCRDSAFNGIFIDTRGPGLGPQGSAAYTDWRYFFGGGVVPTNAKQLTLPSVKNGGFEWTQIAAFAMGFGKQLNGSLMPNKGNFVCEEEPYRNGSRTYPAAGRPYFPAEGTVISGDKVISKGYVSAYIDYWICTAQGTSRVVTGTADTTSGTPNLTAISGFIVEGDFITIAGVTGVKRVLSVDYTANTAVLDSNANASTTGAAIANSNPTWEAVWNGRVLQRTTTPIGAVIPAAVGMECLNTATGTVFKATGTTANTQWVQLN